jgi:hypothetical protein
VRRYVLTCIVGHALDVSVVSRRIIEERRSILKVTLKARINASDIFNYLLEQLLSVSRIDNFERNVSARPKEIPQHPTNEKTIVSAFKRCFEPKDPRPRFAASP